MKHEEVKKKEKPYHPPRLVKYGDLRKITTGGGKGGTKVDHASGNKSKGGSA